MYLSTLIVSLIGVFSVGPLPAMADAGSYFDFSLPTSGTQYVNGAVNPIQWKKGLLDGVNQVDVELARLSTDGILFVARNVPARPGKLNILLQDVPTGDDYFVVFINVTHGFTHAVSPRFSIVSSTSTSSDSSQPSPLADAPTVTISGAPNPTASFATIFPEQANGAGGSMGGRRAGPDAEWRAKLVGMGSLVGACIMGAAWTLL